MRIDPFLLLPLRQAATLYLAVRLAATIPLWFAEESAQELTGVLIGMGVVGCTVLLSAIDQRRNGAPDLYANLGVSRGRLALLSALPAALGEIVLALTLSFVTAGATDAAR
jgi:hypothetical protein